MDYDVIIAGGSFAGLAVAAQLKGRRVLLVEPNPIGQVQTSACGTLLAVLEATGTMDSLLQVHERFVLHLPRRTFNVPLPDPFCTFDYEIFCRRLLAQTSAEVLQASVLGYRGHAVQTTRGEFEGRVLIDATGWRAALATNGQEKSRGHHGKSFGLETAVPITQTGLHFWYQPDRLLSKGVTWLFPIGPASRAGIASYVGETRLANGLENWLQDEFAQSPDGIHGGYFPYHRRPAVTGPVFRVGDAAGQCLPLTGEGIRPALYFGAKAGRLARAIVTGAMTETAALEDYQRFVSRYAYLYQCLWIAQKALTNMPVAWVERLAARIDKRGSFASFMRVYRRVMEPSSLEDRVIMITEPPRQTRQNLQSDEETAVVRSLLQAARMAGVGAERQAIVNVYVSLKSGPFLVLAGEKQTGKSELVKCLGYVLTEIPALQCQLFVGHARWAAQSQDVSLFVEMQDRFNRNNLLALIEEASQKENANRLFIACLTRISPAELYEFFAIPGLQFWPYQTHMEGRPAVAPIPYPPNFRLLGTMDVPHFNGWEEDLLARTTVVRWPGGRVESKAGESWMNILSHPRQSFLPTCVFSEQTAHARLQRVLGSQREAFLPLVQMLDLMHLHDVSLPREVTRQVICYLANSWTRAGAGLFDSTPLNNLSQSLDLALAQYVLPWIVAVRPKPDRLLNHLNGLFGDQFKRTSMFIDDLQTDHRDQGVVSQITYGPPGTFA